jgi:hypothetical protein
MRWVRGAELLRVLHPTQDEPNSSGGLCPLYAPPGPPATVIGLHPCLACANASLASGRGLLPSRADQSQQGCKSVQAPSAACRLPTWPRGDKPAAPQARQQKASKLSKRTSAPRRRRGQGTDPPRFRTSVSPPTPLLSTISGSQDRFARNGAVSDVTPRRPLWTITSGLRVRRRLLAGGSDTLIVARHGAGRWALLGTSALSRTLSSLPLRTTGNSHSLHAGVPACQPKRERSRR